MNRSGAVMFVLFLIVTAASSQELQVPRFEAAPCAIDIPAGEKADCGYLVARENRSVTNGRTIRLPVIILKSDNPAKQPDPVLRTLGGPGASSLRLGRGRRSSPWLADRDYIVFEQRGTRYAQPSLQCPEVDASRADSAIRDLGRNDARRNEVKAAKVCYDRLRNEGIDLNAYNSVESAADIEDLRRVLKLEKINLYGVSYSARLMLNVMRAFPNGIRSVVLESVLPLEANYDEVGVDAYIRVLDEMITGCRSDPECLAAYPELSRKLFDVVRLLNEKPLIVSIKDDKTAKMVDIRLNGDDFVTWIVDYLFSNEPSATADSPYVIELASKGNFDAFKRYAGDKIGTAPYSWGMRYSIWCSEEFPFEDRQKIDAQSSRYSLLKGYEVMSLPDICSVWKVKRAASIENKPVKSDIPALILGAEFDAYTPPDWGRSTSQNIKNSYFFEVPWAGHGPAFAVPCVSELIAAFLNNPAARPSEECIGKTVTQFKFRVKSPVSFSSPQ